jgi:hypothetical protein
MKSLNGLLNSVILRAKQLADEPIDSLRSQYPETTETRAELIRHCREMGLTRGQLIEAILVEEFIEENDREVPDA